MSTDHFKNKMCSVTHYPNQVKVLSDEEIIRSIRDEDEWRIPGWGIHRYYLRLLRQEAHRRGLST